MNARARRRHFSMLRGFHLADLFTIANGFCGVAAVFQAMTFLATQNRRNLYLAALLVPLANVLMAEAGWTTVFWVAAAMDAVAALMALLVLKPMRAAHVAAAAVPPLQPAMVAK